MTDKEEVKFINLAREAGFVINDTPEKQLIVAPYGDAICCAVASVDDLKRFYKLVVDSVKE